MADPSRQATPRRTRSRAAAARPIERIALVGPTGSGKTTIGEQVAALLGWPFVDLDQVIATEAGQSIAAIFAAEGEAGFRAREVAALRRVLGQRQVVVATGGGIGDAAEAAALLEASAWLVALSVPPEVVWERLHAEAEAAGSTLAAVRPMLSGRNPLARLRALDARRRAWYERADEVVVAQGHTPESLVRRIVASLAARGLLPDEGAGEVVQRVRTGRASGYDVVTGWGAMATLGARLAALGLPPRLSIVADATVAELYEPPLMAQLMRAGFQPVVYRVPPGEASKSRAQLDALHDWLAARRMERGEAVVALGGGVVGDLAGFAAATYLRGVPLIQVPTSLLAQVDASVGGKVAIDHPLGKNLLGAFYPPRLVLADPSVLVTLPPRVRTEGWAEVVKHGVALSDRYFRAVERAAEDLLALRPRAVTRAVAGSVSLKAAVVGQDEREAEGGRRVLLNYGHTLGHAIEVVTGYGTWLHGEAVAVGMCAAARLGLRLGITPATVVERQEALLTALGLPTRATGLDANALLRAAHWDKKVRDGRLRWVLPTRLGTTRVVSDVPEAEVRAVLRELGAVEGAPAAHDAAASEGADDE